MYFYQEARVLVLSVFIELKTSFEMWVKAPVKKQTLSSSTEFEKSSLAYSKELDRSFRSSTNNHGIASRNIYGMSFKKMIN